MIPLMGIKVVDVVADPWAEPAWDLYVRSFEGLDLYTVQRHLMYRDEFDGVMADDKVQKYLCLDEHDRLRGLSAYTNHLDRVPLISWRYFRRRWPRHYEEMRIWYCEFVAVPPPARGMPDHTTFHELVEAMCRVALAQNGIIALDMSRLNDRRGMSRVVPMMLNRIAGEVRVERMDEQSYWLYEFPAP
jgi:hypothetical protein